MHQEAGAEDAMNLVEDIKFAFEEYYQGRKDENALLTCLAGIPIVYVSSARVQPVKRQVLPYFTFDGLHQERAVA